MHGIFTAIGSLASIACYATSLHGASTWLPSFQGFNGIEVLTMTVTMTWIIVCGCFPAVKAAYTLISISRKEMGSLPLQFGWSLLGFGVLTMLHVVEGEAEAGVDAFRLIMLVWLGGMSLSGEVPIVVISGTLLVANDRYFYGCAIPLIWGIAICVFDHPRARRDDQLPLYCQLTYRVRFLGISAVAGATRRCIYLWMRGAPVTICQVRTMHPEDGLVQSTMLFLWSCFVFWALIADRNKDTRISEKVKEREFAERSAGSGNDIKKLNFRVPVTKSPYLSDTKEL